MNNAGFVARSGELYDRAFRDFLCPVSMRAHTMGSDGFPGILMLEDETEKGWRCRLTDCSECGKFTSVLISGVLPVKQEEKKG